MKPISNKNKSNVNLHPQESCQGLHNVKIPSEKMSIMKYSGQLFMFPITHCSVIT